MKKAIWAVLFILIKFNLRNGVQKKKKHEGRMWRLSFENKEEKRKKDSTQTQMQEGGAMLQRPCVTPCGAPGPFSTIESR